MPLSSEHTPPSSSHGRLTWADYAALPNDGQRYELIEGAIVVTPSPTTRHQRLSRRLLRAMMQALEDKGLGEMFDAPMDVVLDAHTVVQPDLLFITTTRADIIQDRIHGAPDVIVEILSQSTRRTDVRTKRDLYARHGVCHYWIVDPDVDRIDVYILDGSTYRLAKSAESPDTLCLELFGAALELNLLELFA